MPLPCQQYGNNRIGSDHHRVKRRLRAMQGLGTAGRWAVIQGIEAVQIIRKDKCSELPARTGTVRHGRRSVHFWASRKHPHASECFIDSLSSQNGILRHQVLRHRYQSHSDTQMGVTRKNLIRNFGIKS
jgi:hypothetical protein